MVVQGNIQSKLQQSLSPSFLSVENESHMHAVPKDSETHFKVTIVTEAFDSKRLLQRHRMINELLKEELAGPVHALALHTYTSAEWESKQNSVPDSPNCMGGS